jgi:hypothetical protein
MPMILAWVAGVAVVGIVALGLWLYAPDKPRAELEAAYPGNYRTVDGVRLRLRDTGPRDIGPRDIGPRDIGPRDAPAVILLHGFGSSLDTWEPWARVLSSHYRVNASSGTSPRCTPTG